MSIDSTIPNEQFKVLASIAQYRGLKDVTIDKIEHTCDGGYAIEGTGTEVLGEGYDEKYRFGVKWQLAFQIQGGEKIFESPYVEEWK